MNNSNEKQSIYINSNLSNDLTQIYNINFSNRKNIQFLNYLTKVEYTGYVYENEFSIPKSINNILYLIYGKENKSIIYLNLINEQIVKKSTF